MLLKNKTSFLFFTYLLYCGVCDKALGIKTGVRPLIAPNDNNNHFLILRQCQHEGILLAVAASCVDD